MEKRIAVTAAILIVTGLAFALPNHKYRFCERMHHAFAGWRSERDRTPAPFFAVVNKPPEIAELSPAASCRAADMTTKLNIILVL